MTKHKPSQPLGGAVGASGVATVLAVCCGAHALALGALAGAALSIVLGIGGAVIAAVALVVFVLAVRRRRAEACSRRGSAHIPVQSDISG